MHLTLHLTSRCDLRCRYCYAAPHKGGDLTLDTAKKAIDIGMAHLRKRSPEAPHETLLVLDATTGVNGLNQAREFHQQQVHARPQRNQHAVLSDLAERARVAVPAE